MQDALHTLQLQLRVWNGLDWALAACIAVSVCAAFARGFIRSAVSLLALCLAVVAAMFYAPRSAPVLLGWFGSPLVARVAAFTLILVAVYVAVALLGRLLSSMCRAVGLGFFDRVAGAAFGFLRAVLLLAALLLPLGPYLAHSEWGHGSVLLPYLLRVSLGVSSVVPHQTGKQWTPDRWMDWVRLSDLPGGATATNHKDRGEHE